eukprot:7007081-Pyramimonas_sp.AAC.1
MRVRCEKDARKMRERCKSTEGMRVKCESDASQMLVKCESNANQMWVIHPKTRVRCCAPDETRRRIDA